MNWLSHIFLSLNDIDYQLGNILADPMKGKCWVDASPSVRHGFSMHILLDRFTDENLFVARSKARFTKKGLLKGVVIDIVYDHFLLRNWSLFAKISHSSFMELFYANAMQTVKYYPPVPQKFIVDIVKSDGLLKPLTCDGLAEILRSIDSRLARKVKVRERAVSYLPLIMREREEFEGDFLNFFPQAVNYFKEQVGAELGEHWLR